MKINTNSLVSITEVNQNFSEIERIVDKNGSAIILKDNKPKYIVIDFKDFENFQNSEEELIDSIAERILNENLEGFKELAK